ncbi:ankyrin repeat, SAM and basic leucine zipper domain-containing protein 1-like [Eupeodes corollae]|uniref:ankyrin repeat, SAM and basic leucine zipper domain-containing protein 1-like n=1 Tax=Eupeodes corollae TaxID=290404 RepID=UPI002493884C|nr:ankyrin repeat, SAM and basic leucine zipper domain-containing protein 1-like [Eupeodes corollae]
MNEINRKLLQAVEYGKVETVRDLLNQYGIGASEANGYVLLRKSVSSGSRCQKITELLLINGAKANSKGNETHPSHTPLHYAVGRGDIETVELLLNYNADINVANERRVTPLMLAITIGNEKIIDILFDRGAYVSASCIHLAVQNRQITEKLLQLGVSANCTDYSNQQFTPLLSAAQYVENSSVVELLLKHGANVNAPNCIALSI